MIERFVVMVVKESGDFNVKCGKYVKKTRTELYDEAPAHLIDMCELSDLNVLWLPAAKRDWVLAKCFSHDKHDNQPGHLLSDNFLFRVVTADLATATKIASAFRKLIPIIQCEMLSNVSSTVDTAIAALGEVAVLLKR